MARAPFMRMRKKRRRWLNPSSSDDDGYVISVVDARGEWCSASLSIGDCYRLASLDFDFETEAQRQARLRKARGLIECVEALIVDIEAVEREAEQPPQAA